MEFNVDPYHDDFEQNAKDNNYVKILFKPGVSVQARELTQIQSILQNQIKSFGDHIFQDGSPVIGGNLTLDNKISYVKLDETYNNEDIELDLFLNKIILRDSDSAVQAKVLATYYPSAGTPTLMVKYISGAEFNDGDVLKIAGTTTRAKCIAIAATGIGTVVSINEGIFYAGGYFVQVNQQTAVVSAYSQNANVKIGLEISDDVVDYVVDSSLLDPAQESFNYQAPGADRYQFNLNLSTRPLDTAVDESSFFELMRVENGAITKQVKYPIYSEIEKTLARRTFDESGDYTIKPFVATVSQAVDSNKYILNIGPGKAYVKGFEFETLGTFKMTTNKPRTTGIDTKNLVDIDIDTSYGNYLKFKNVWGSANSNSFLDIFNLESVDLHLVSANSVNIGISATANTFHYANTKIGTAKIRNIQRDAASTETNVDSNGTYRIYLTDIAIKPRLLRTATTAANSQTINLSSFASPIPNAYQNVSITVLPIALTPVANVNTANIFVNSTRVNANSSVLSVFLGGNVNIGDIIRVNDDTRKVISINTAGDFLTVNNAFTQTVVGTNKDSNPVFIFKQTDYTSNVTNQTRVITSYTGASATSAYLAFLDRPFDENSVAAANTVVQLNYGIKDLECIMEANVLTPVVNAHANVALESKLLNGDVELYETSKNTLLYRLPREYAARGTINGVDYYHTKYLQKTGTSGVFVITVGQGMDSGESVPWSITNAAIQDNLIAVAKSVSATSNRSNGSILQLTTANVSACGAGIQINTGDTTLNSLDVYINVKETNAEGSTLRTKALKRNTNYTTYPYNYPSSGSVTSEYSVSVANKGTVAKINVGNGLVWITDPSMTTVNPGDAISLYVPDVIKIRKILKGTYGSEPSSGSFTDVTDWFTVDYGQRDTIYDHAKIILKQGYSTPNSQLLIHCDFFNHTYPAGASFFSVDSYEPAVYSNGEVPVYYGQDGSIYYLRDCLDFRPTRQIGLSDGTIVNGKLSAPDTKAELSYQYYLPRIDKLVLSKNKEFRIIQGVSSAAPVPPDDSEDAMTLYNIYLPPYVPNVNDIRLKYFENKRYTMKDISSIDKRVKAIEYYTSLNNIENTAINDNTTYEDGTDKAKYGIIGEGFRNYNIADYKNADFTAHMEKDRLTPIARSRVAGLKVINESGVVENEKTITLSYTETPAIVQDVTSNKTVSVQPFLFASFIGHVKLTPEIDFWVSETLKPEVIRGPEVTQVIKETTVREVIHEKTVDPPPQPYFPPPVETAKTVIIETPGKNPIDPKTVNVDIPTANNTTINPPAPPVVIPVQPTPTNYNLSNGFPVPALPQPNYPYSNTWPPFIWTPTAWGGTDSTYVGGLGTGISPVLNFGSGISTGLQFAGFVWPDDPPPSYNPMATPAPSTALPIYDSGSSVTASSWGATGGAQYDNTIDPIDEALAMTASAYWYNY